MATRRKLDARIAEIETQVGRPLTTTDLSCVDINEQAGTATIARNPLLKEVHDKEMARPRDKDLPANQTPRV